MLIDRKLKILQAIIDDFISTAQPVGSRTIAKKYDLGISSATIRNEMADLEEMGYLLQPHTSSGRIPSDLGYRLYVDNLMELYKLANEQKKIIRELLLEKIVEIDDLFHQASKVLSQITNLTSLSLPPQFKSSKLKNINLVPIDENKVLMILVSDTSIIKNVVLKVNNVSHNSLNKISNLLQYNLRGLTIEDINEEVINNLKNEIREYSSTIETVIPYLIESLEELDDTELYLEGITNIFKLPEYCNVDRAKQFISIIEKKDLICKLIKGHQGDGITVRIGQENNHEEVKDCSIITATYKLNGQIIGKIGVIGPTRIDYSRIIPVIEYITKTLTQIFNERYL